MKTTVQIDDSLFRATKAYCARHGLSFRQVIEAGLRLEIEQDNRQSGFKLGPFGFAGEGQQVQDWASIREMIYEGRGGQE